MKKRILSLFLALMMCLTLLPTAAFAEDGAQDQAEAGEETLIPEPPADPEDEQALAVYAAGAEHTHFLCGGATCNEVGHAEEERKTTFTAWDWSSTNGTYYLTNSGELNGTITVPKGSSLTLCLNGYDITMGAVQGKDVIMVEEGATFTLCDCKRGGSDYGTIGHRAPQSYNGTGVNVRAGTFYMYGGKISNNVVGYFESNNGYGGGVFVSNKGTFNMIGGEITGNTARLGGGVYACASSKLYFTISGSVQITDNCTGSYFGSSPEDGKTNNIYLEAGSEKYPSATIQVGTLASMASIGVTTEKVGQLVAENISAADAKRFFSDASDCRLKYDSAHHGQGGGAHRSPRMR